MQFDPSATYALQLTARASGAIGVMLLTGRCAAVILQKITANPKAAELPVGQFCRSTLQDGADPPQPIDDALIVRTGACAWELHTHGSVAVMNALTDALHAAGAQVVSAEQAESLGLLGAGLIGELPLALSRATTSTALRLLLAQPDAWAAWTGHWLDWLSAPRRIAQDLWQLHSAVQWLLARSRTLMQLLTPPRIVIFGPPNAGKSTLANALLGRPVSITSNIPGTTRDWIDAQAIFTAKAPGAEATCPAVEVAVTVVDTAGIRPTADDLEQASIARTHDQLLQADLILLVLDSQILPSDSLLKSNQTGNRPSVIACNKRDLAPPQTGAQPSGGRVVHISALTGQGLDALMSAVLAQLDLVGIGSEPFAFTPRLQDLLESLAVAIDPAAAMDILRCFTSQGARPPASPSPLYALPDPAACATIDHARGSR